MYFIFTWLTNFQLEQYSKFILNLPKNYKDYKDYFLQEEQKDGYSKIKAFKDVQDKECLARKYLNLKSDSFNNYTADTSKAESQISGEPPQRILICEDRRISKFDVPNFEVSKVYSLLQENTFELQEYLKYPDEYNTITYTSEFLGSRDSYYNYSCDNV